MVFMLLFIIRSLKRLLHKNKIVEVNGTVKIHKRKSSWFKSAVFYDKIFLLRGFLEAEWEQS